MTDKNEQPAGFEKLWAPWRMQYIDSINTEKKEGCIFCDKPQQDRDRENYILLRGESCYVVMNIFPYNNGHLLVVPYLHTSSLDELDAATKGEIMDTSALLMRAIGSIMRPDGFNMGMNFGRSAGAGIAEHLHMHLVPRWNGDTNFMPVIGGVKVISESLDATYEKISKALEAIVR